MYAIMHWINGANYWVLLDFSTTPPQTPAGAMIRNGGNGNGNNSVAVTITTSSPAKRKLLEDDDDDIRRSTRACKGRRYQEFKDAVGKRGRRGATGKCKRTRVYFLIIHLWLF